MDLSNAIKKMVADSPVEIKGRPIIATISQWRNKSNDLDVLLGSWDFDRMDLPGDFKKHVEILRQKWKVPSRAANESTQVE